MGRRIVYSPDSRRDYEEIYLYIAADNPAAAEKLLRTFDEKLQLALTRLAREHGLCLVQLHRSLFAMHCPCNNRDYETPHVCWSAVEHATTASGERPSLTRRLRVTTMPDPACQRWRPTSLPDCGARRMYSTNRAQHDSCVQSRHDDLLASQIISP